MGLSPAAAVIRRQIVDNDLGVGGANRRAVGFDHFIRLRFPAFAVQKPRIDARVVERVAGAAIAFNKIAPWAVFERDRVLRPRGNGEKNDQAADNKTADHASSHHVDGHRADHIVVVTCRIEDELLGLGLANAIAGSRHDLVPAGPRRREREGERAKSKAAYILSKLGFAPGLTAVGGDFHAPNAIAAVPGEAANFAVLRGVRRIAVLWAR